MNFFTPKSAAERYAKGRPYFHPLVIQRSKEFLSLREPLRRALDLGCGTGLSTIALKEIASVVVGVDASREMIALAPEDSRITYLVSSAENLPFGESEFDLITMSQVFHWLDRGRFFAEARRVLRADSWLIIYDNYFSAQIDGNAEFHRWHRDSYLERYPSPPRAWASFAAEGVEDEGFHLLHHEEIENTMRFSPEGLVDYLVTQSNVIAAVEGGGEKIGDVRAWLTESTRPFFGDAEEVGFLFRAPVWFLRRAGRQL